MHDRQSKPAAAGSAIAAGIEADEGFEYPFAFFWGNAWAIVFHLQACGVTVKPQADA
ncbi:hypothetical protein D3C80_2206830 [compost metagenome]